jgi:hypothetical protein
LPIPQVQQQFDKIYTTEEIITAPWLHNKPIPQPKSKWAREMKKLDGFFNPTASQLSTRSATRSQQQTSTSTSPTIPKHDTPTQIPNNNAPTTTTTEPQITPGFIDLPTTEPLVVTLDDDNTTEKALSMVFPITKSRLYNVTSLKPSEIDHGNPFMVPATQLCDILSPPINYEEAFYHPDPWCRQQWRNAINLDLQKMQKLQVWHVIDVPKDRKTY